MASLASGRVAGIAALAVLLGACTTYGTGVNPGKQTLEDVAGIMSLGGKKPPPVDYKPRGPIVAPPANAALPAPGSGSGAVASADWPRDPDELAKQSKAANNGRSLAAGDDPGFRLPKTAESSIDRDQMLRNRNDYNEAQAAMKTGTDAQKQKQIFATAKGGLGGSVDANGNPIRKSLTEPPVEYRAPDPTAPTAFTTETKKKKWWPWSK